MDDKHYLSKIEFLNSYLSFNISNSFAKDYLQFQEIENNLNSYFAYKKLILFNKLDALENYHGKKLYKRYFKRSIFEFVENNITEIEGSHHMIYLEYLNLKMLGNVQDSYAEKFVEYFHSLDAVHKTEECVKSFLFKLDYYYRKKSRGESSKYTSKLMQHYMWAFNNGYFNYFLTNGVLYFPTYLTIIFTLLHEKKHSMVKIFIDHTRNMLDPQSSEEGYKLAKAFLLFEEEKYDDCFTYLNNIKTSDCIFYFYVKILLAKIHFEKKEYEYAGEIIDSMKKYLVQNKKIIHDFYNHFQTNVKFFGELINLARNKKFRKKYSTTDLKSKVSGMNQTNELFKSWYLKALKDLKG